jgi:hypothetical protein
MWIMTETPRPTKDTDKNVKPTDDAIRRALPKFLMEMLAITFGVILAFMLNEWRVDMKRDAFVERSLAAIEEELSENYDRVLDSRNYHLDLYPDILAIIGEDADIAEFQREKFRGTKPPRVQTAAYDIAIQSAILSDMPIEDAKKIATAYSSLVGVRDLHQRYSSAAFSQISEISSNPNQFAYFLRVSFMDFLYAEDETLQVIRHAIDKPSIEPWWTNIYGRNLGEMGSSSASKTSPDAPQNTPQD